MSAAVQMIASADLDDNAAVTVAPSELGAQAARGTAAALFSQLVAAVIYAASSLILARLLSPEDFGVFAISFAVIGVLEIAQHGGLVVPLVQTRSLTQGQLATLFWLSALVGAAQAVCGWLAAPLVSWMYADPRLTAPIAALAAGYVVTGLTTTQLAVMRRRMDFGRLAIFEVSAVASAAVVAATSAWLGAGYWSLVYLQVVRRVVLAGLILLDSRYIPSPRLHRDEIAPLIRFGRVMIAFEAVGFANSKLDNLILGWFAGPVALGFYAKAYEFLALTSNQIMLPISGVMHSTLSRVQDDARRYETSLVNATLLTASAGLPLIVFIAAHAPLLFPIVFGDKWLPAAAIFRALAPGAVVMVLTTGVGWIFLSLGRAHRQLPWALTTTAVTIAAFFAGAPWGAMGVATAFSISRVILFVPTLVFTCRGSAVRWTSMVRASLRPLGASVIAALASSAAARALPDDFATLLLLACVFAFCYVVSWIALPGGLALIRQEAAFIRIVSRNA